ncbi:MAG: hypothetical protein GEU83_12600 [Pseudonocardiaceae bacterium]|nr:hypothetical protein [Pseudonocardiaceae bacterium]
MAWLVGVFGGAAAAGVAAGVMVLATGPPAEPGVVATPPPSPGSAPESVRNTEHCEKGAETLGDVGRAVTDSDSLMHDSVIAELDNAESRIARRVEAPSRRLTATFAEIETSLRDLRHAIEDDDGVGSAVDTTRDLMGTLSDQCYDVLLPAGGRDLG